ncbi:hypothetical protein GCM10018781_66120 [Kitasatospora indigofera]|uniref:Uncharacterized protein n=1 Tax=Kitasatospora indigofera TaxID=67307 RepID=A0A919L223_9ACTN|nr:hypothetical protein GCM10018781_66120 [Kitasatospora indigofera]
MSAARISDREHETSVGALAARASQQMSRLVRERLRLARAEKREKGRRLGAGGGGCWTARGCSGC